MKTFTSRYKNMIGKGYHHRNSKVTKIYYGESFNSRITDVIHYLFLD